MLLKAGISRVEAEVAAVGPIVELEERQEDVVVQRQHCLGLRRWLQHLRQCRWRASQRASRHPQCRPSRSWPASLLGPLRQRR